MSAAYDHVSFVAGNNEYKSARNPISKTTALLKANESPKLTVLENEVFDMEKAYGLPITILGCTLWSKIREDAGRGAGDGRSIPDNDDEAHTSRFEGSIAWIRMSVLEVRNSRPKHIILVMSHHAQAIKGVSRPKFEVGESSPGSRASGFGSNILGSGGDEVNGLRAKDVWVYGHTHFSTDVLVEGKGKGVRVVVNQRGGPSNDTAAGRKETKYEREGKVIVVEV